MNQVQQIITQLKTAGSKETLEGMARYGINPVSALGVNMPILRSMARQLGQNHSLALKLWDTNIHEAMILASMVAQPGKTTKKLMDTWANTFYSWDLCDQVCMNLFEKVDCAYDKAIEWSKKDKEYVRRAGFVMMARLAVSDKKADNKKFEKFFPYIIDKADDDRNFVKKAVSWAIRQIGKRNVSLNKKAIALAKKIQAIDSKAARWSAADALRELKSEAVQNRLLKKKT